MHIAIRRYKTKDIPHLANLMDQFEDYLIEIDTPKIFVPRPKNFGKKYIKETIKKIKKGKGAIFVATMQEKVIGLVAGVIQKSSVIEKLEHGKQVYGNTLELFVAEEYRGKGVGKSLLRTMEKYFKVNGCTQLLIGVFAPNKSPHELYKRLGYKDVGIEMKKLIH